MNLGLQMRNELELHASELIVAIQAKQVPLIDESCGQPSAHACAEQTVCVQFNPTQIHDLGSLFGREKDGILWAYLQFLNNLADSLITKLKDEALTQEEGAALVQHYIAAAENARIIGSTWIPDLKDEFAKGLERMFEQYKEEIEYQVQSLLPGVGLFGGALSLDKLEPFFEVKLGIPKELSQECRLAYKVSEKVQQINMKKKNKPLHWCLVISGLGVYGDYLL